MEELNRIYSFYFEAFESLPLNKQKELYTDLMPKFEKAHYVLNNFRKNRNGPRLNINEAIKNLIEIYEIEYQNKVIKKADIFPLMSLYILKKTYNFYHAAFKGQSLVVRNRLGGILDQEFRNVEESIDFIEENWTKQNVDEIIAYAVEILLQIYEIEVEHEIIDEETIPYPGPEYMELLV